MKETCAESIFMACGDMVVLKFYKTIKNSNQTRRNSYHRNTKVHMMKFQGIVLVIDDRSALRYLMSVENNHFPCRNIVQCDGTQKKIQKNTAHRDSRIDRKNLRRIRGTAEYAYLMHVLRRKSIFRTLIEEVLMTEHAFK